MNCRQAALVVLLAIAVTAGVVVAPSAAAAQPAAAAPAAGDGAAPAPRPAPPAAKPAPRQGGGIIRLDEEVIEGRIQKPEAFYILQRSNLNYESLELKRSFIPNILESVKKDPF